MEILKMYSLVHGSCVIATMFRDMRPVALKPLLQEEQRRFRYISSPKALDLAILAFRLSKESD
jgi:hypothetical protein